MTSEVEALRAEVEQLARNYQEVGKLWGDAEDRADKAEAEVERLKWVIDRNMERIRELEAAHEKLRLAAIRAKELLDCKYYDSKSSFYRRCGGEDCPNCRVAAGLEALLAKPAAEEKHRFVDVTFGDGREARLCEDCGLRWPAPEEPKLIEHPYATTSWIHEAEIGVCHLCGQPRSAHRS